MFQNLSINLYNWNLHSVLPEWSQPKMQSYPYTRLYYIVEGEASIGFESYNIQLKPGNQYLIPDHLKYNYRCPSSCLIYWIHFNIYYLNTYNLFHFLDYCDTIAIHDKKAYVQDFNTLIKLKEKQSLSNEIWSKGFLLKTVSQHIQQEQLQHQEKDLLRLQPIIEFIHSNLHHPIKLHKLANLIHLQVDSFGKLFKRKIGLSPKQFILKSKMEKAKFLLQNESYSIQDIANQLGFNDAFHFSNSFKKWVGSSPRTYRKSDLDSI